MKPVKFLPLSILLLGMALAPSALGGPAPPPGPVALIGSVALSSRDVRTMGLMDLMMPVALAIAMIGISQLLELLRAVFRRKPSGSRDSLGRSEAPEQVETHPARLTLQPAPQEVEP